MLKKTLVLILLVPILFTCSAFKKNKTEKNVKKEVSQKKYANPSIDARTEEARDKGGFLFGSKKIDPIDAQSPLWRATLEAFDNIPIESASYSGGIINTSWYSNSQTNESIKITVLLKDSELKASSIKVNSFKKTCQNGSQNCLISKMNNSFNQKIKDSIISKAKEINIKREEKK